MNIECSTGRKGYLSDIDGVGVLTTYHSESTRVSDCCKGHLSGVEGVDVLISYHSESNRVSDCRKGHLSDVDGGGCTYILLQ